ncbi:hypothetical protein VTO42DRAFT_5613 [Malbranchea cinnamomea]
MELEPGEMFQHLGGNCHISAYNDGALCRTDNDDDGKSSLSNAVDECLPVVNDLGTALVHLPNTMNRLPLRRSNGTILNQLRDFARRVFATKSPFTLPRA